jgi:phosphoglycerate dehydrogenase-like enzyme
MRLLRWGRAEYEHTPLVLPKEITIVEAPLSLPIAEVPLESAEVLVVPSKRPVGAAEVARLKNCRLVLTTTSGYDHLDLVALREANIQAARLPLARRDAVVQTALGMILSLSRRLGVFAEAAKADRWLRAELPAVGATLLGTVGVVGAGVIGSRMVEVLKSLGATTLISDPAVEGSLPLEQLLAESDVLTLHCELTLDTRNLLSRERIFSMKPGSILVNTARGKLVDVEAARDAVEQGRLAGLGLDVFPEEPCSLKNFADPRVLVSPHASGWHPGLGEACNEGVRRAVEALIRGEAVPFSVGTTRPGIS